MSNRRKCEFTLESTRAAGRPALTFDVSPQRPAKSAEDSGMSTAEYAVGLAIVVAMATVLLTIVQSHQIFDLFLKLVSSALKFLG